MVFAETEKRAEELVQGTVAKYPHTMPDYIKELVIDRADSSLFLFAYGEAGVWACNKKHGIYNKDFYVTRSCALIGTYNSLSESINAAKL